MCCLKKITVLSVAKAMGLKSACYKPSTTENHLAGCCHIVPIDYILPLFLSAFSLSSCHVQLTAGLGFLQLLPTCEQSQCCKGHFGDLISQTSLLATREKKFFCEYGNNLFIPKNPCCQRASQM
uniref:Uncharacterized protein n=1 Tax=Micrurus lemniscatus lemniscatus TaxID=129467 RepID=A0A2D4JIP2_MICLE